MRLVKSVLQIGHIRAAGANPRNFYSCIIILFCLLSACSSRNTYAPVVDIATIQPIPHSGKQRVARGETLYKIAFQYGLDHQDLARRNHIRSPYQVKVGQQLYLKGKAPKRVEQKIVKLPAAATRAVVANRQPIVSKKWAWPAQGKIVRGYAGLNKGINIANHFASPVYATNGGTVVYSGNGLRAYGNLIIIKHNDTYMSAYAHNSRMLVNEGDSVRKGQKIAEMGSSGTNKVMLHFEIRRNGRPVNPMKMLKS